MTFPGICPAGISPVPWMKSGLSSQRLETTLSEHLRLKAPLLEAFQPMIHIMPPISSLGKGRKTEASKNSPKKERLEKPLRA